MPQTSTEPLRFSGMCERRGPISWPQHAILSVLRWEGDHSHARNLSLTWEIPGNRAAADVLGAFTRLVDCCQTLRTTYRQPAGDAPAEQVVHGTGEIPVRVSRTGPEGVEQCTRALREELGRTVFDVTRDMPLTVGLVMDGGRPVRALCVISHAAVDGWSLRIVRRLVRTLLDGGADDPYVAEVRRAQQPLERAEFEQSADGRELGRRTLDFWADSFRRLPLPVFAGAAEEQARPARGRIHSHVLAAAVRDICRREPVTSSCAVLAAASLLLSSCLDVDDVAVRVLFATRFRPEARHSVGAVNLNGLFRVPVRGGTVTEHLRAAHRAFLLAGRYSQCDPVVQEEALEKIMRERGADTKQYLFFNDNRFKYRDFRHGDADGQACCDGTTRFRTDTDVLPDKDSKFLLAVHDMSDAADVSAHLDGRFFGGTGPVEFLRALESLLVVLARDPDAQVTEALRRAGVHV